jgi:quercetin dioxygenase-like cupin family protein
MSAGMTNTYNVLGNLLRFLVRGSDGDSSYSLMEGTFPPGHGAPPNRHAADDEAFYILEGTFEFMVAGETKTGGAGTFVKIPRGAVHAFKNIGRGNGRLLVINSPGHIHDAFFSEAGDPLPPDTTELPPSGPPDIARALAAGQRNGIEFILDGHPTG